MDADEVRAFGADEVVLATGSQPDGKGFQRAIPERDALLGIESGNVWSAEEVMRREARLGRRVIVLDETANWKGAGTALHLAETGHQVTVVTPAASIMAEMARTNADIDMRTRLRQLGVRLITEAAIREWHGDGATIFTFGGPDELVPADSLVIAATNVPERTSADELGPPARGGSPGRLVGVRGAGAAPGPVAVVAAECRDHAPAGGARGGLGRRGRPLGQPTGEYLKGGVTVCTAVVQRRCEHGQLVFVGKQRWTR